MKLIRMVFRKIVAPCFERLFPGDKLITFILMLVQSRLEKGAPKEGLRFLFRLENNLYPLQGTLSIAYGGGLHTKHRHMRYHDFFADRITSSDAVLDVGCGIGAVARTVASKTGARVTGIDLNAESIAVARESYAAPGVSYQVGDVLQDIPAGDFNILILSNVLEHLPDRSKFLEKLVRSTGAGRILVRVPLFERDWRVPLKKEIGEEWRLDQTHETEYIFEDFVDEVGNAGLTIVHHECRWGEIWAELIPGEAGAAAPQAAQKGMS